MTLFPESDPRDEAALAECRRLLPNVSPETLPEAVAALCNQFEKVRSERTKLLGLCRIIREYVTGDDERALSAEVVNVQLLHHLIKDAMLIVGD